jgi:hypothetical protein
MAAIKHRADYPVRIVAALVGPRRAFAVESAEDEHLGTWMEPQEQPGHGRKYLPWRD